MFALNKKPNVMLLKKGVPSTRLITKPSLFSETQYILQAVGHTFL